MLESGDKPVKVGGFVTFITLQFNHIYCVCGESKVPFITFQIFSLLSELAMKDSDPSFYCTKT